LRPQSGGAGGAGLFDPEACRLQAVDDGKAIAIEPKALAAFERNVALITVLGDPKHPAQAFDQAAGAILDAVNATRPEGYLSCVYHWEHLPPPVACATRI
jgi:hypothetical protein